MPVHACPQDIIRGNEHLLREKDREFAAKLVEVADKNLDSVKQRFWLNKFADEVIYAQKVIEFKEKRK